MMSGNIWQCFSFAVIFIVVVTVGTITPWLGAVIGIFAGMFSGYLWQNEIKSIGDFLISTDEIEFVE